MSETGPEGQGELRVRAVRTRKELAALAPAWDELLARSEAATPFMTSAWAVTWFETCGRDLGEPLILLFEDDAGLAGLAPLALTQRGGGPFSHRVIEFLGSSPLPTLGMGLPDRCDLLLARRHEGCVLALVTYLAQLRSEWDVVDLRHIPEDSVAVRVINEAAPQAGLGVASEVAAVSPYLRLDESWEAYLRSRSQRFRKGLKRAQRALAAEGEPTFELLTEEGDIAQAVREAVDVSERSWKGGSGTALLLHAEVRRMLELLIPRLAESGSAYIALLRIDGRAVAHELGFRLRNKLWAYDSCFDGECPGSPGTLLMARLLERAYEEGHDEYDFMRGDEEYKMRWQPETRRELQLVLDAGSLRARLTRKLAFEAKWLLKRHPALVDNWSRLAGVFNRKREGWGS